MKQMIDLHAYGIRVAAVGAIRSTHLELRAFCQRFEAREQAEFRMLQDWLVQWFGIRYTPRLNHEMREDLADLTRKTGQAFDTCLLTMLIDYDNLEIYQARQILRRAVHRDLKALARDMVAIDSPEVRRLKAWLDAWGIHDEENPDEEDDN